MAPTEARKGDRVCLLLGCRVPVLLRKREEGGYEGCLRTWNHEWGDYE